MASVNDACARFTLPGTSALQHTERYQTYTNAVDASNRFFKAVVE